MQTDISTRCDRPGSRWAGLEAETWDRCCVCKWAMKPGERTNCPRLCGEGEQTRCSGMVVEDVAGQRA